MTLASYEVREFRGQLRAPYVLIRQLAARFRRGESLEPAELVALRNWASENCNVLLLERVRQELRTERRTA